VRVAGRVRVRVRVLRLADPAGAGPGPPPRAAGDRWSFDRSRGTYGYRRIHADLNHHGILVGEDLVRHIAAAQELIAGQPRPWRRTTLPDPGAGPADLVGRDFTADAPSVKLVGDITYIPTWASFAYLATVIDCYPKQVISWAVADHMRTDLVTDALDMARRNQHLTEVCIFHSDRGTQYTSHSARRPPHRAPDARIDGPDRGLLGQRNGRVILRGPKK